MRDALQCDDQNWSLLQFITHVLYFPTEKYVSVKSDIYKVSLFLISTDICFSHLEMNKAILSKLYFDAPNI